jgi:hypothetical protein
LAREKKLIADEFTICKKTGVSKGVSGYGQLVSCENRKNSRLDKLRTQYPTLDAWEPLLCQLNPSDPTHEKHRLTKERQVKLDKVESDRSSCDWYRALMSLLTMSAVENCDKTYEEKREKVFEEYRSRLE